jgi:hypothetical protein
MKNIHLLPTDKPSRLYLSDYGKELNLSGYPLRNYTTGQHIYITNDEEIKEGDWTFDGENPYKWTEDDVEDCLYNPGFENYKGCKKIILTTDQDLIKDGVQAIDDEFLEWFVNNPSCEEIEVEIDYSKSVMNYSYKIIIPKEEPNPFELPKALPDDVFYESLEEPKQENTLEEAAARYTCGWGENDDEKAFIAGAKWQQERMYSEEDMRKAYNQGIDDSFDMGFSSKDDTNFNAFIEQFKKK